MERRRPAGNHNSAGVQFSSVVCGHAGRQKRPPRGINRTTVFFCAKSLRLLRRFAPHHERAESVFAKIRLEQVRPDSAFWSSEMFTGVTWKPRASMRARVRGNDAGKMIVPPRARALAA